MNIGGISSTNSYSAYESGTKLASKSTEEDPRITSIQKQIAQKEQSMKSLENNDKLTDKEKTEEKKKLQDDIAQLNQQLVEVQNQIQKEKQEKNTEETEETNKKQEELQKTEEQKETEALMVPEDLMETMTTAQVAMSQSGALEWIKTKMEGEARTAASDATQNAALKADSSYLEDVASDAQDAVDTISAKQISILGKASDKIEKSVEEKFKEKQKEKAEERIRKKNDTNNPAKTDEQTEQKVQQGTTGEEIASEDSKNYLNNVVYKEIDVLL